MMICQYSIAGLENYLNKSKNVSLFDNCKIPDGIDRETLISNIMMNSVSFPVLYNNPIVFNELAVNWFNKWFETFNRMLDAINIKYNAIDCYYMEEERTKGGNNDYNGNRGNKTVGSATDQETGTINTNDTGELVNNVTTYDSNSFNPNSKDNSKNSSSSKDSRSTSSNNTRTDTSTNSHNEKYTENEHKKFHGNIGNHTPQQMIREEIELAKFNLIEYITKKFIHEFCVCIY